VYVTSLTIVVANYNCKEIAVVYSQGIIDTLFYLGIVVVYSQGIIDTLFHLDQNRCINMNLLQTGETELVAYPVA